MQPISKKFRYIVWIVLGWAIVSGCFVTDLFVCPWTAVFLFY